MTYKLPVFGDVSKISLFEAKLSIKLCLVLRAWPTESPNQNLRPLLDLFRHHKSTGCSRIAKRAIVEMLIFQGNLLWYCFWVPLCFCFFFLSFFLARPYFGNKQTSWLILMGRIQFSTQISILTNKWKFHILDEFATRVGIFYSKLEPAMSA